VFGSDDESSDEESEAVRDKRLEREYVMVVIKSLVSGEEPWDAFPMSQFKAEIRQQDDVANPHLSWAVVKARLLGGGASSGDRGGKKVVGGTTDASKNVGAASAEVSARTIPPTAEARAKRHELRKALLTVPEERTMHQIELLVRGSEYFPFLSRFSSNDLRSIWSVLRHGFAGQGETLLKEGHTPSMLNIILSGRCWLRKKVTHDCGKSRLMTLDVAEAGESIGEDELRRRLPMRTSVVASQDLEILKLTQEEYAQTIGVVNRRDSYAKEDILKRSRVFNGFREGDGEIPRLALLAQRRYYKRGDVVAEIGKPASVIYLIVRGLVDAVRPVEHKTSGTKERTEFDIVIATLTFGKCIGASVVLDPFAPRYPATFKCTTAVEMLVIGKEAFDLRKITSGVMMSLERASCRSLSIDACMHVIEDKRKHADNRMKVLREFRYVAPKKKPTDKGRVSRLKLLAPLPVSPIAIRTK
jgi:CRP-like cAMP-binding protein